MSKLCRMFVCRQVLGQDEKYSTEELSQKIGESLVYLVSITTVKHSNQSWHLKVSMVKF